MVRWGSRFLVLMDHAGEQFEKLVIDVAEIPFLQHTPVTILLLSLPDLTRDKQRVDNLINSYITSLEENGVNFAKERRQLIIVFSKADLIPDLPPELSRYLSQDITYLSLKDLRQNFKMPEAQTEDYIRQMSLMSNAIREWVNKHIQGGAAMLHMLDNKDIETRFTIISATGHPLTNRQNNLAPTPRRVLDPFFWVLEYYKQLGSQDIVQAKWSTIFATFSPALRAVGSLVLLALLFFCTLAGSLYASSLSGGDSGFVGFCLSLVLLFICTLINQRMKKNDPPARSILNTTRLALFLSCVVLQTLPSVRQVLSQLTLYQLLGIFMVGTALFSCFQPATRLAAQSRVTLATIAGTGALLQYTYGGEQVLSALPFMRPDAYVLTHYILTWVLMAGAGFALLLSTEKRVWLDRAILFVVAPIYGAFQFIHGPQELLQALPPASFPFMSLDNVVFINRVLVFILALALPLSLFFLYRFARIDRLPLLILAIASAGMINFLGSGVKLPIGSASLPLLTSKAVDFLMPDRIVQYGLVAASLLVGIRLLFIRFSGNFAFWDHVVLFFTAVVCTQLQVFPWESPAPQGILSEVSAFFFAVNRVVASSLTWLVFSSGAVALVVLLLPVARQFKLVERIIKVVNGHAAWLTHLPLWLARVMAFGTGVGCTLLMGLYGEVGSVPLQAFSAGGVTITFYQIAAPLFAIFPIITLCRLRRPFTRGDRLLLLINIFFCTIFYFLNATPTIPLSLVLQGWNEGAYHSQVPDLLFAFLLVWMALISFWWSVSRKFSGDRRLLQILSGLALTGGLLQLMAPSLFFTLLALLTLIMGVIIATISASSTL